MQTFLTRVLHTRPFHFTDQGIIQVNQGQSLGEQQVTRSWKMETRVHPKNLDELLDLHASV